MRKVVRMEEEIKSDLDSERERYEKREENIERERDRNENCKK
jgi:hypothetical protein